MTLSNTLPVTEKLGQSSKRFRSGVLYMAVGLSIVAALVAGSNAVFHTPTCPALIVIAGVYWGVDLLSDFVHALIANYAFVGSLQRVEFVEWQKAAAKTSVNNTVNAGPGAVTPKPTAPEVGKPLRMSAG